MVLALNKFFAHRPVTSVGIIESKKVVAYAIFADHAKTKNGKWVVDNNQIWLYTVYVKIYKFFAERMYPLWTALHF